MFNGYSPRAAPGNSFFGAQKMDGEYKNIVAVITPDTVMKEI